ncbi:MAG: Ig-like domain-containing protein [Bifidobacteriaceae bacterium]|nr:Ig-like domain-containing protein [Bifidobacteriaceae bacterium]
MFAWEYTDLTGAQVTGASAAVAANASGVATYDFGSNVATTWSVSARLEGAAADVGGSPKPARFVHGPLDRLVTLGSFAIDSSGKLADGIAHATASMRAQDQFGNPIPGVDLGLLLDYPGNQGPLFADAEYGTKSVTRTSGADGLVSAEIYSIWPGYFNARGAIGAARSGAKQVHFQGVPADPGTSWFNVKPLSSNSADPPVADGQDGYEVTVALADANRAPLNGAGAVVYFTPRSIPGASQVLVPVVTGSAGRGRASAPLTTLKAGTWDVTVRIGNDQLATDDAAPVKSVAVQFAPGPVSMAAGASRLVAPAAPAKADGQATQLVAAEVRDANGNGIAGQTVVFAIPAGVTAREPGGATTPGPAAIRVPTGTGAAPGVADLTLTSTKTGAYEVTASVGGVAIADGSPAGVVFVNTDLSLGGSEFAITTAPAAKTVVAEHHTVQVTLRDASGNLYAPAVPVSFSYRLAGTAAWTAGPTVNTVRGVATWADFTVRQAGRYEVRAETPTGQVPDSATTREAVFKAGPALAAQSVFTASTGDVAPNNSDQHSATVEARDAYGNPVPGQSVTFALPAGGPAHFTTTTSGCLPQTCAVITSATGLASVAVASPAAVTAHITATLGLADRVGEADLVFAAGAAEAARSTWSITPSGPLTADGAAAYSAAVQVNDASGNAKAGAEVSFALPAAVKISEAAPHLADQQGQLTVHLTSEVAGTYTVNALIGADRIPQTDQKIAFAAGPISADPGLTLLTGPASAALADGSETQAVTAWVRDAKGNPVTNAKVRFAVPAGTSLAPGGSAEVAVGAAGQAELRLVSRRAGRYEVTAEAKAGASGAYQPIAGGSPTQVSFAPGPAAPTESRITKVETGPLPADGTTAYTLKVQLADQYGNPVNTPGADVAVTLQLVGADGSTPVAGVAPVVKNLQTDATGQATTTFATTRAGLWRATAAIAGGPLSASPPPLLEFKPLAATAAQSEFGVTGSTVLADGKATTRPG